MIRRARRRQRPPSASFPISAEKVVRGDGTAGLKLDLIHQRDRGRPAAREEAAQRGTAHADAARELRGGDFLSLKPFGEGMHDAWLPYR